MIALPEPTGFWRDFWKGNNACLYGKGRGYDNRDPQAAILDSLEVRPAYSVDRPHVPVLVEFGEDWVIEKTGANYQRYIRDHDYQVSTREACAATLLRDIEFRLKPKIDTASLLHGSIYGNQIKYSESSSPWLDHAIHEPDDVRKLIARMEKADLAKAGLVPEFVRRYKALDRPNRWRIEHDTTAVHGPGTILSFLFGISDFMFFLYDEPELAKELIALVARLTVEYSRTVRRLTGGPPDGVSFFDDVSGLVSPDLFEEFLLPAYELIFGELASSPGADRFLHNDARVGHLLPFFRRLGVNGINPDPETPPRMIRDGLPNAIIYGCVPPLLLKSGTPEEIYLACKGIIDEIGRDGGLVLTTAGSINAGTPYENILALCYCAQEYGRLAG